MNLRQFHLVIGITTVLVFLGTGAYMRMNFPMLYGENEVIRYMFRANHVYLLFSGLLNIVLGISLTTPELPWKRLLQRGGSWILLLCPVLFFIAFLVEPPQASPARPITLVAVFLSLFGVIASMIGGNLRAERKDTMNE